VPSFRPSWSFLGNPQLPRIFSNLGKMLKLAGLEDNKLFMKAFRDMGVDVSTVN